MGKKRSSRKRRGLPAGEAGVRGRTPPPLPPSAARWLLSDPALVAGGAALALALLGLYLVGQTGDDVWAVLVLPVLVVVYLGRRGPARDARRATVAWWQGRRDGR